MYKVVQSQSQIVALAKMPLNIVATWFRPDAAEGEEVVTVANVTLPDPPTQKIR